MGCAESTDHDDDLDHSLCANATQHTADIDANHRLMRGTPRAAGKPIGFSRVAEIRLRRQHEVEEAENHLHRDAIPPLTHQEGVTNAAELGPAAIPANPLNARSRLLVFDADPSVSPIHSGTSIFSDGPPAADQQTVAFADDDVLSQASLTSSAPVMSNSNSNSGAPEFSINVDGSNKPCGVAEDVPSPLPTLFS